MKSNCCTNRMHRFEKRPFIELTVSDKHTDDRLTHITEQGATEDTTV